MILRAIARSLFSVIRFPPRKKPCAETNSTADTSQAASTPIAQVHVADGAVRNENHQVGRTQIATPQHVCDLLSTTAASTAKQLIPKLISHPASPETAASPASPELTPAAKSPSTEKYVYIQEIELTSPSSTRRSSLSASTKSAPQICLLILEPIQPVPSRHEIEIMQRKIWVRRPGASATLVTVDDNDLVDAVRDAILQKYANSLGRSIDSPDITLKICSREQTNKNIPAERALGPEEQIGRILELYYAGGQTIDEALIIDVPQKRTPRASPRVGNHHPVVYPCYVEDHRPGEGAREYFPPMAIHSPHLSQYPPHPVQPNGPHLPHSMAVLTTGQLPTLPSPGAHSTRKHGRPKYIRQHTSSPTILHSHQPTANDVNKPTVNGVAPPAPLPTPPAQIDHRPSVTPPNRTSSPQPGRPKRKKQTSSQQQAARSINGEPPQPRKLAPVGLLDGNAPPINVLIVEDNVINLRLLEQFMRRLKVRWKTAMNGREAVNTWRTGGFHLVLMDIQLPVMSGLEATKEIRRLESVNGIGLGLVGGQNANGKWNGVGEINPEDKLSDMNLFKSPVIIVALTASSLQSDRHEALAVGCNDFLTKPVGYPWMLRKVTEWGCMQALIDFDGWRKWKEYAAKRDEGLSEEQKKTQEKEEKAKQRATLKAMFAKPPPGTPRDNAQNENKNESGGKSPVNGSTNGLPRGHKNVRRGSGSGSANMLQTHHEEADESN